MDKVRWWYWINRSCEEGMMTDYICLDRTQAIISFIPDQPSGFHRKLWLPVPFNLANPLWGFISISGFHHNYTRPTLYGFATITLCQNFATFIGKSIFPRHYIWPTFSIFYREFWLSPILHLTNPMWLSPGSLFIANNTPRQTSEASRGRCCCDRIVAGFTATCKISNQCLSPLKLWVRTPFMAIQHYVIVSYLRQVGGFLRVFRFP